MQILVLHPNVDALEMVGFSIESQMGIFTHRASSFQSAIDVLIDDNQVQLLVAHPGEDADKLFKYMLSANLKLPVILLGPPLEGGQEDVFPDIQVLARLPEAEVSDKIAALIKKYFKERKTNSVIEEYCRIATELLVRVVPLRGDIFIRLSDSKYVKMFKTGATFTREDMEKYLQRKKVKYLYIRTEDSHEFIGKFNDDMVNLIAEAKTGDPEVLNTVSEVQSMVQDLADRIGFTPEIQDLARQNIQLTVKAIGASPKLTNVFSSSLLKSKNFISSHSVMLANISCAIAAQMVWPSNTTFQKLVLASLFHDFSFNDPALAKISTKQELEQLRSSSTSGLTDEQYLAVKNHPQKASEVVRGLSEVPGDVDFVVAQHHERPDGTGFPKGMRGNQIPPLSAVFIISHDLLNSMIKEGEDFDMKAFVRRMESTYQSGSFRKVWRVLAQSVGLIKPSPDSGEGSAAA